MAGGRRGIMVNCRFAALALALLASAGMCGVSQAQEDESRRFGDWTVACDVADFCRANTGDEARLVIQRHQHSSHWELLVEAGGDPGRWVSEFTVQVDDLIERFAGFDEFGPYGGPGRFHFLSDKAQDVLAAMLDGRTARFALLDEEDNTGVLEFSLVGLSASLLWIDERQQRIGSARLAGEPPYGVLPFGPEVDTSVTIPAALVAAHRASEDCEPLEWLASGRDSVVAVLDDGHALAVLPCNEGAYNFAAMVYHFQDEGFSQLYFAEYSEEQGWFATNTIVNVNFDPQSKEITTFDKGRGPGDCGSVGRWRWTGDEFLMKEYRYQAACDGTVEPGDFPVIFSAKAVAE